MRLGQGNKLHGNCEIRCCPRPAVRFLLHAKATRTVQVALWDKRVRRKGERSQGKTIVIPSFGMSDFKKLRVWRKAHALTLNVHRIAASIRGAQFAPLRNQMVRAAMSVSANIVEGREQRTDREFARFLGYALASASELEHHFIVARDLRAITDTDFSSTLGQIIDVRKMVHGLLAKLSRSKKTPSKRTVPSTSADSVKRTAGSG